MNSIAFILFSTIAMLLFAEDLPMNAYSVADLIKKLGDQDSKAALDASDQLIELGKMDPAVIDALIEALKHKNRLVRHYAASALGGIGPKAEKAIPTLAKMFQDKTEEAWHPRFLAMNRSMAANSLGLIGAASIPVLREALKDSDPKVRDESVSALSRMAYTTSAPVPLLIEALGDKDDDVRCGAVSGLKNGLVSKTATGQLRDAMTQNTNPLIRVEAASTLVAINPRSKDAIEVLTQMVSHRDKDVRTAACHGFNNAGVNAKAAIPQLITCLEDDHPKVRNAAVYALSNMGSLPKNVIRSLIKIMDDKDQLVREAVGAALDGKNLGKEHVHALVQASKSNNADVCARAFRLLGEIGPNASDAIPTLRQALTDDRPLVVESARDALERIQK